jgi:LytS/YehU family sensor histidine kinase
MVSGISWLFNSLKRLNIDQATPFLLFLILLAVELNYKFLFKKKLPLFLMGCIATGLTGSAVIYLINFPGITAFSKFFIEPTTIIALYTLLYPLLKNFLQKRLFRSEVLLEQSRAELQALKAQLNPHFLFNSFNSLYGLALEEKAERTAESIGELAEMMRYLLENQQDQFVPLGKEIAFTRQYLALQQKRLPAEVNKALQVQIEVKDSEKRIPHLLFLPLLENVFKYGVSLEKISPIRIFIRQDEHSLILQTRNSILKQNPGAGTGLKNLKKRLELLYPKSHSFKATADGDWHETKLIIQF